MGLLYSHIVFQPPSPPTYSDDKGMMKFRKARNDIFDNCEDDSSDNDTQLSKDNNLHNLPNSLHVQHPLIYLRTSKGNIIPAAYFDQPDSYYTILFSHGNGEDLGVTASYVLELSNSLKTSVLCYDYSGYGIANGKPSESNCYADIRAAYTYLVAERRIPRKRILLFGRSLGSGPTIDLATSLGRELGGVVLIAALTSCVRVVFNNVPHTLKFDMFANIDKIDKILVPIFCVHGMIDDVVPFSHGLELSRRARYPLEPLWIRHAGHNNLESARFQYEVFLRYMKVLQEMRRWKQPDPHEDAEYDAARIAANHHRRRDSFGRLVKVAGCFSPQKYSRTSVKSNGIGLNRRKSNLSPESLSFDEFDCDASCVATDGESIHDDPIQDLSSSPINGSISLAQLPGRFGKHSTKRRHNRHISASSSQLYLPGVVHHKHESDLRAMWLSEDDELVKKASIGIFRSRETKSSKSPKSPKSPRSPRSRVLSNTTKANVQGHRRATVVL